MNIIVSKVYDKQRFAWFMYLKYGYPLSYTKTLAEWIDDEHRYSFSKLTEAEVRYLQATNSCRHDSEYICKLKIIPTKMPLKRKRSIPPYLDNERTSCINTSSQPGDESKQEQLELFHVKFTKVIHFDEMLNERQIQALLKDKNVKSINIDK
jgi:hypothetical protein